MVFSQCHPARKHYGKGLCSACYQRATYSRDKEQQRWAGRSVELNRIRRGRYSPKRAQEQQIRKRKRQYGITEAEYEQMILDQDGRCALCHDDEFLSFHTDHDHETRRIRGLLCSNCNTGLGKLGDSVKGVRRALRYLSRG